MLMRAGQDSAMRVSLPSGNPKNIQYLHWYWWLLFPLHTKAISNLRHLTWGSALFLLSFGVSILLPWLQNPRFPVVVINIADA
jgi:hypothetical protein